MSRLFPAPFRQYIRSAIRGDSVGILKEAEFGAEAEVFPQPLLQGDAEWEATFSLDTPVEIPNTPPALVRLVHVESIQNVLATASWTCSGDATEITPTDAPAPAVFTALAEVEQI